MYICGILLCIHLFEYFNSWLRRGAKFIFHTLFFSLILSLEMQSVNLTLNKAKKYKNDEFYTQLCDIEKELTHYKAHFKNKVIYCNCDDPRISNFFKFFVSNFKEMGIKKVIATCYKNQKIDLFDKTKKEKAIYSSYNGVNHHKSHLLADGDFRSKECLDILKVADIVVTNPPFSLFREFFWKMIKYNKKFIILGSLNAIAYEGFFRLLKNQKIWLGINNTDTKWFEVPDHYKISTESRQKKVNKKQLFSLGNAPWYTNLKIQKEYKDLKLKEKYYGNEEKYPAYDNYKKVINIDRMAKIPKDYYGVMGVPVTFIDNFNPSQFELVAITQDKESIKKYLSDVDRDPVINGKRLYRRIFIKRVLNLH